jgi:deazaflavin-dependent oxidoreductase (nitroreductase family)
MLPGVALGRRASLEMGSKGLHRPHVNGDLCPTGAGIADSAAEGGVRVSIVAVQLNALGDEPFCYLTTIGRKTARRRTVEIWFAVRAPTVYLLSGGGGGAGWVRNLLSEPEVEFRIGAASFTGRARVLEAGAEEAEARQLLLEKYQPTYAGDLTGWSRTSLPVAVDLRIP